jgi:hypothetical protein
VKRRKCSPASDSWLLFVAIHGHVVTLKQPWLDTVPLSPGDCESGDETALRVRSERVLGQVTVLR